MPVANGAAIAERARFILDMEGEELALLARSARRYIAEEFHQPRDAEPDNCHL